MATRVETWVETNLSPGTRSLLTDLLPENMATMKVAEGGIHCVPMNSNRKGHRVRFNDQPTYIAAAILSWLAESLVRAALNSTDDDRATAFKKCLDKFRDDSFLFDMILLDEKVIRIKFE
ncbi:hypothetical protein LQW54_012578 [Pestalotiopsis sp. IQ-011]